MQYFLSVMRNILPLTLCCRAIFGCESCPNLGRGHPVYMCIPIESSIDSVCYSMFMPKIGEIRLTVCFPVSLVLQKASRYYRLYCAILGAKKVTLEEINYENHDQFCYGLGESVSFVSNVISKKPALQSLCFFMALLRNS